ncbi:hypothetical protein QI554_19315 [Yinghuangia seranimata]|nr:hypothetical protein [Yinghuangia seranimata]
MDPALPENPANPNTYPKSGYRFVAIQWKITNTGLEELKSDQIYSTHIVDDHGEWHLSVLAHIAAGACFPSDVKIPPGESRLGFLVYELPLAAKANTVRFDGDYDKPVGTWKLT